MQLELAPTQHFILTAEDRLGHGSAAPTIESVPTDLPWQRPINERMRTALRLGVLLAFLVISALFIVIRASNLAHEAQDQARAEARALALSAAGPLVNTDRGATSGILDGLSQKRSIAAAAIYDQRAIRIADFAVSRAALLQLPHPGSETNYAADFFSDHFPQGLVIWEPIKTQWEDVGWVVLEADISGLWNDFFVELSWIGAALLGTLLLCAGVVNRVLL